MHGVVQHGAQPASCRKDGAIEGDAEQREEFVVGERAGAGALDARHGFSLVLAGVAAHALSSTGVGGLLGAAPLGRPPAHAFSCEADGQDGPGAPGRA